MKSKQSKSRKRKGRAAKKISGRKIPVPVNTMVVPNSATDTLLNVAGVLTLLREVRSLDSDEDLGEGYSLGDGRSHVLSGCVQALIYVRRLIAQPGSKII